MSPKKISNRGESLVAQPSNVLRPAFNDIQSFCGTYAGWLEKLESVRPVYRLPSQCVGSLTRPLVGKRPILDDKSAEAEMAFADLCCDFNGIGYWRGQFIGSGYLVRPDSLPNRQQLAKLGWTAVQIRYAERLVEKTDSISLRLKGYAGWLVLDPEFMKARDELACQWEVLGTAKQPFPIQRSVQNAASPKGARKANGALARYQAELNGFLDRWGLVGMLT